MSNVYGTAGTALLPSWRCFGADDRAKREVQRILDEGNYRSWSNAIVQEIFRTTGGRQVWRKTEYVDVVDG